MRGWRVGRDGLRFAREARGARRGDPRCHLRFARASFSARACSSVPATSRSRSRRSRALSGHHRQDHHRAEGRSSTVGPAVGDRGGQSLAHDAEECGNSSPLLGDQCAHPVGRSHRLGIQHPELAHFPPGPASAAVFVRVSVARQFSMLTTLCPMRNVGELCAMEANPWWRKQRR